MGEALASLAREARTHVVTNADGAAKQAMPTNVSEVGEIKKERKKGKKGKRWLVRKNGKTRYRWIPWDAISRIDRNNYIGSLIINIS